MPENLITKNSLTFMNKNVKNILNQFTIKLQINI